ncbi:TetR family transcriptional regulator [Alkalihalobacterium chitinilyticum]|uniref:TetR family transcriptional regulator n=1 Tax=Alkalihalobacterium chitinilyticum TaxID=2980103 RepID=A0ABT5VCN6_9BACI|nr:TetR family transcriptional regulator [Alkalihalobacterium chitinilyticum]MDE5413208.1 TetR family transcriptional regulator [Alkalihalobacterium chitinilyticum]
MKQDNKYELLVNAALTVMKEKGFEKASVSQIVKEAGVAQGTFYLYFDSKSAIVPAIAEKILNALFLKIKQNFNAEETIFHTLEMIVEVTFDITKEYRELILFCYSGLAYYHSFERWEEIYQPYYSWLEERLDHANQNGLIHTNLDLNSLAKMIIDLIENSAETYYLTNESDRSMEHSKNQVLLFIKSALTDSQSLNKA